MHGKSPLPLGRLVITPGAMELLQALDVNPGTLLGTLLRRHATGDWGELDDHDQRVNHDAVLHGLRVLSSYPVGARGDKVWIITEADRSVTTILLPEDY